MILIPPLWVWWLTNKEQYQQMLKRKKYNLLGKSNRNFWKRQLRLMKSSRVFVHFEEEGWNGYNLFRLSKTLRSLYTKGLLNVGHPRATESVCYWMYSSKISSKVTFDAGLREYELPIWQGQWVRTSPKAGWVGRTQQISFNELNVIC